MNDYAWGKDLNTRNYEAIEMVVACNQDVSATILGDLNKVVVTTVGRHHSWRVDRIGEPHRFLFNSTAEFINLIPSDAVPP